MHLRDLHGLVPVLLLLACSPKPAETDGESGSSGSSGPATDGAEASSATQGADATSADPSTPTTTEPNTSFTTQPPQTASSTPETGDTVGMATDDATATDTSAETGGLLDACTEVCTLWEACEPGSAGPLDECVADCNQQGIDPACATATDVLWSCVADLPCEQALSFLDGPPLGCFEELDAADEMCGGESCAGEIGGDEQTCELMQMCDQGEQHIVCDEAQCTCTQDDVVIEECDAMGFCSLGFEAQRAAVTECCGWVW